MEQEKLFDKKVMSSFFSSSNEINWDSMPEYNNVFQPEPMIVAKFKFRNEDDYKIFKDLIQEHVYDGNKVFDGNQKIEEKQAWFPHIEKSSKYIYTDEKEPKKPRFPIYIVSKGRWERNPTSKALKKMNVPFYIVVEKDEYEHYKNLVDESQLLILPQKHKDEYDRFWDDDDERCGPGAARNFVWEHSMSNGFDWHWVMDDNIDAFNRFNNNMWTVCDSGTPFWICEEYVLRYENVGQAGLNYCFFCPQREGRPPVKYNTRIYSCLLIRNDIPYRWRGRYNEDTDLSLRMLKDGWCTIQFNAFLQSKRATQTVKGGNSKEFYDGEGTYNKSQMLVDMHPDVTQLVKRWNRVHHHVDYSPFEKNKIILKEHCKNIKKEVNDHGMVRKELKQ